MTIVEAKAQSQQSIFEQLGSRLNSSEPKEADSVIHNITAAALRVEDPAMKVEALSVLGDYASSQFEQTDKLEDLVKQKAQITARYQILAISLVSGHNELVQAAGVEQLARGLNMDSSDSSNNRMIIQAIGMIADYTKDTSVRLKAMEHIATYTNTGGNKR